MVRNVLHGVSIAKSKQMYTGSVQNQNLLWIVLEHKLYPCPSSFFFFLKTTQNIQYGQDENSAG